MPAVYPFRAVTFASPKDLSALVAPPYDVLDSANKARLLAKDARNIVGVDLPHTPAKELGPASEYAEAGRRFRGMLGDGTLVRSERPVMFAYRQTFTASDGKTKVQRAGMACVVDTVPFGKREGGGILPHEETFSGPKEDRLALMRATNAQLSPVFGLHVDERGLATKLLHSVMAAHKPDRTATTDDGTLHEVWTVADGHTIFAYEKALAGEDVFIADGHHRYTTALNYSSEVIAARGGSVGHDHPSRKALMVLVSMSDPGLVIWPTHRVLGGMKSYTFDAFAKAAKGVLAIRPAPPGVGVRDLENEMNSMTMPPPPLPRNVLGLYDFATRRAYTANLVQTDPLGKRFPGKPRAWRELDVAIVQHAIVEDVCQTALNSGEAVKWAFPHTLAEVEAIGAGAETGAGGGAGFVPQLAVIVRPTPLSAVRDICAAGVLMPQKSTFFYPKLATGLFMHLMA